MNSVPMVMTLPRKPLVKDRSWPMEPTIRLTSSQCWSQALEQYSTAQPRLLWVRGTILGSPVVPPVGPMWATCRASGRPLGQPGQVLRRPLVLGDQPLHAHEARLVDLAPHRDDVPDARARRRARRPRWAGSRSCRTAAARTQATAPEISASRCDLVLPVAVDEHHRDGADLLAGEVDRHELGPVGQLDHHPVQRLDPQVHQTDGQPLGRSPGPARR